MSIRTILLVFLSAAPAFTGAAEPTRLLMQPTVHGDRVAFRHGGDLWIVPLDGGLARRLTTSEGVEDTPRFSPDGRRVAFTGQYDGQNDVYVIPAAGGTPRRITYHPGSDVLVDWTPDGTRLLFASGRENPPRNVSRLWTIPLDGGMPDALPLYAGADGDYAPNGNKLAYVPVSPAFTPSPGASSFVGWKHYRGGRTSRIRIVDLDDLSVEHLPRDNSNDFYPMWAADRVYFLSDRDGTMNLYSYDGQDVQRHTWHEDFDIKSADTDGASIVYEQGGYLYHFDLPSGQMRRIAIEVRGDFPWTRPHFTKANESIRSVALSPTGVRAVLGARGEIFTVPVEKGDARNLSQSPGAHDRFPAWSPDGQSVAWFSDASGEYALYVAEQEGLQPPRVITFDNPTFYYKPAWSPDSTKILFVDKHRTVWYLDLESETAIRVDSDLYSHPARTMDPVWSPDSRWIAYARRLENQLRAIFVYSLDTGETHQITDGLSDAISPAFDAGGKYLYFLASTDFALNIGWLDMTSYDREVTRGVYLAVLSKDEPSPLLPESDEEEGNDARREEEGNHVQGGGGQEADQEEDRQQGGDRQGGDRQGGDRQGGDRQGGADQV